MLNTILELHQEFYTAAEHEALTRSISPRDCEADDAAAKLQKFQNRTVIISQVTGMVLKRFFPERAKSVQLQVALGPQFESGGGVSHGRRWVIYVPPEWWLKPSEVAGDSLPFGKLKDEELRAAMREQFGLGDEAWFEPTDVDLVVSPRDPAAKTYIWACMAHFLARVHFTQTRAEQQRRFRFKAIVTLGACIAWVPFVWRLRWQAKLKWAFVLGSGVHLFWLDYGWTRLKGRQFDQRDRAAAKALTVTFQEDYSEERDPISWHAAQFFEAIAKGDRKR
jgi:hypothetical protein